MSEVVLKVENVSKKFCRTIKQIMRYGSADVVKGFLGLKTNTTTLRAGEFWALDNVSLELKKGETLGIVGSNGSGKSTLLKLLNGIYMPDRGRIEIKGDMGALIEVGAGFSYLLTGRENVYVNGTILGLSKEQIDKKFDTIVAFAELEEFIDVPLRNYSSGMSVRLGFSVAVHCEVDILLMDEILAVGDAKFKQKCIKKIDELKASTSTIFVSHDKDQILRICDRVIILNKGRIMPVKGTPTEVMLAYEDILNL
ncbi:MAG: ABC transporter ATP-binding protein [Nitrosomonadaceae bacterium]